MNISTVLRARTANGVCAALILRHILFLCVFRSARYQPRQANALSVEAAAANSALYVTWDVISETLTLLRYRRSHREALTFLVEIKPNLYIVNYGDGVRAEAEQIFRRYGRDHKLSYYGAVSFVVVTTLLEGIPFLAFDADFRALGLVVIP